MTNLLRVALITLMLGSASLTGCSPSPVTEQTQATAKIPVTVSIEPQKYFVERIGRDRVGD
jgi:ABC-type Zn uptake system ZnuABC Zn-binding protein ZnuA